MKKLLLIVFTVTVLSLSDICVVRTEAADICITENKNVNDGCIVYSDGIIYKYRIYNGRRQYRRWDKIKQRWVDPHWINM